MRNVVQEVKKGLVEVISQAIEVSADKGKFPASETPDIPIEVPREKAHGDFTTTVALALARSLKKPPRDTASATVEAMQTMPCLGKYVARTEVAGPGFINFFLNRTWLHETIKAIDEEGDLYGTSNIGKGLKVLVEFVSANPTGPMNVVGARAGAVGDVLVNLLQAVGYDVSKEYYVNDAGNQIDILGKSVETRYWQLRGETLPFPPEYYQGEYIIEIAKKALAETRGLLDGMPRERVSEFLREFALREIIKWQQESLQAFGVKFDVWFSERTLVKSGSVEHVIKALREKGMLYEANGAIWFKSTAFGDDKDRVVIKSNGEHTYLIRDLAYHRNKLSRGFDRLIDIWGPDHHGYVARTKAGIEALGYPGDSLEVLLLQLVRLTRHGEQVKMSKRAGEFVTMDDIIEEAGVDAARYFFVMRNIESHLDFDLELAKEESMENPVYYVQYAHARICSIFRQAGEVGAKPVPADEANLDRLREEIEIDLIKKLAFFPDEVEQAALNRSPNRMAMYALDMAGVFHSFYKSCRVISEDKELTAARLALVKATHTVLKKALGILGVSAPERM